jgi:chaperonin GroES
VARADLPMPIRIRQMMQLGDVIAAAFEEAELLSSDPRQISRLATIAVEDVLRSARRVSRHIPARIEIPAPISTGQNPPGRPRAPTMNIQPLYDRVLATRIAEPERTPGGLYIPDTAKEKPLEALVVSVGSGKLLKDGQTVALRVKPGDRVLIGKYSGSEVKLGDKDHIILREDDILAIIDN